MWDELVANARDGRFPKGADVFRYKFHGLFYVAPAQDAFMCRLRIPNGISRCVPAAGGGRPCRALRRRLRSRDHPREPADPRDPARERGPRAHRTRYGRAHLARRGCRQHPQRHRQPDRGHRPAGALRRAAARPRACITRSSTTASCTGCPESSTSPSTGAAGSRRSRIRTTSGSPPRARRRGVGFRVAVRRHHRASATSRATSACRSRRRTACRSRSRWCASSSSTATARTGRRRA